GEKPTTDKALIVSALLMVATSVLAERSTPLMPLVVDGERYFRLQWEAGERAQRPEVHGHILNEFGFPARKLRLLVNSLDPAGALTDQTLVYVPGELRPGSRYYFDSRHACPHAWRATVSWRSSSSGSRQEGATAVADVGGARRDGQPVWRPAP